MPILTLTDVYEHGELTVRFTCVCGQEHSADFTTREYFKCPTCKRKHYPVLRLKTVQPGVQRRPS